MERQKATTEVKNMDAFSQALIQSVVYHLGEEGIPSLQKKGNEDDFSKKDPKAKAAPADPAINIAAGTGTKQSHGAEIEYTTVKTKDVQREEAELEEAKNKEGKEQGADGKACWKGYKYAGTEKGKDKCVKEEDESKAEEEKEKKMSKSAKEKHEKAEDKAEKKAGMKEQVTLQDIVEKAVSKSQQRFMGMVHAKKKGEMKGGSEEVKKAAASMTGKEAEKFASTKHKGLPEKKKTNEALDPVGKEDADVNNDGKTDNQDKFLKGRRSKVSKIIAAKKKVDEMIALEQEIIAEKKQ
jgi:hypothetical protein